MLIQSQKGVVHLGLLILLLLGLVAGVYLVQHPQIFKSKAAGDLIWLVDENGNKLSPKDGDIYEVDKPQIRIKINQPDWSSQPQTSLPNLVTAAFAQSSQCDGNIYSCSDITCPDGSTAPGTGCYETGNDPNNRYRTECLRNCPASNIQPTQTPVPPAVTNGITCESINGQCGDSEWKLRGSGATCSGINRSYKGYNDGDNYTDCDTLQGQYPYCYTGCETAGRAALTTGACRDLRPDETVRPPTDPEPVDSSKYIWKADCSRPCTINKNCPQIDNGINSETSNWCYGFEDGKRCLQLQSIVQPTATPPPDVTDKIRISLKKDLIDFRNSAASCSPSQDLRQNCSELTYGDLISQGIITWNLPDQPGTYPIWVSFYSAQKRYKEISITVNYLPKAIASVQPPLGQALDRIATIPKSIMSLIKGVPIVSVPAPAGVPAANPALGGQIVKVPAQQGMVTINTPANAPVPITVQAPARDVPMLVRLQPEPIRALPQPLVQGTTPIVVMNLDFFRADTLELLRTHPQLVTIAVKVTPALLAAAPELLSIVRFDRDRNEYLRLPTVYDAQRGVLSAGTSETSTFSIVVLPPRLAMVSVDEPTALPGTDLVGYLPYLSKGVGGWNTGFTVGNLSDVPATITIEYFWASDLFAGSDMRQKSSLPAQLSSIFNSIFNKNPEQAVLAVQTISIPPRQSFTFFGRTFEIEDGFQGSAVIRSDRPMSVIVNEIGPDGRLSASYAGISRPSRVQYLPILMRENRGWNTELFVQNAGSAELTDGLVEIMDGSGNVIATVQIPKLPPGYSFRVDQALQETLGKSFVGSAKVRGSQPLATMVNQTNGKTLLSYSGFSGGQRRVSMPLITNDNRGWFTSLQVQNVGERESEVTLYVAGEVADVVRIAAGGSHTWYPVPGTAPGFVGSAEAVGEPGARLVGIVNELNLKKDSVQGMSYQAFTTGTDLIELPLIMTDNYGWYTGIQVQNIGSTATTVTMSVNGEPVEEVAIAAGQSKTWYPVPGTSQGFIGTATVEGSLGSQLVGIVNQVNLTDLPGDTSMVYEGTNR